MTAHPRCRIAYLVSKYPDVSHTFILREVLALRERGIAIDVASINAPPPRAGLTAIEAAEADRTFYVKPQGAGGALTALCWTLLHHPAGLWRGFAQAMRLSRMEPRRLALHLAYWAEALILARWMASRGLRHLHVHFATPAASVALLLHHVTDVGFSLTVHGPDEFYDVSAYSLPEKLSAAQFAVAISFFARSQMMKLTPAVLWPRFEVARLGVDPAHFAPQARSAHGTFRILCVGRLVPAKGQRILLDAVAALHAEGRSVALTLVGDGPDRAALESAVRSLGLDAVVRFTGAVNQDAIGELYANADVFALASFAEGIPVVLMEAMAQEIPCVATRINGIPELIEDGANGLLVAPSDTAALVAALARLMDSPELRTELGRAARHTVIERYNLASSADHLAALFVRRLGEPTDA